MVTKNLGGRPPIPPEDRKVNLTVRIAPTLAAAIQARPGYGARVEAVLQQAMEEGKL